MPPPNLFLTKMYNFADMKASDNRLYMYAFLLARLLLFGLGVTTMQAQTCEGRVCLKNGSRLVYAGDDRLEMPRKNRDVQVYRNFLSRQCQRDIVPMSRVDSVVVWNSSAPQNVRVLIPPARCGLELALCWPSASAGLRVFLAGLLAECDGRHEGVAEQ